MMKQVLFGSTNTGKIRQFQFVADSYKFLVEIASVYVIFSAIKSYSEDYLTCEEIVDKGSAELFAQIRQPIVVEDSIFEVNALDGRPGLMASEYLKKRGRKGILDEMVGVENRKARITSCVGYRTENEYKLFKAVVDGTIGFEDRFLKGEPLWVGQTEATFGGGFNGIFIPDLGDGRTLAEYTATEGLSLGYREPNFKALLEYITH